MADADLLGPRRDRAVEDARGGGEGVLVEEVVLDGPDGVEAEPVGQLDLLERVVERGHRAVLSPGPRDGQLVHQGELHQRAPVATGETLPWCRDSSNTATSYATR